MTHYPPPNSTPTRMAVCGQLAPRYVLTILVAAMLSLVSPARAEATCPDPLPSLVSGLELPLGITRTNLGNLLVSETGTFVPNTGRLSIVAPDGGRRTLLGGLPSAINDVGEPSGPAGLFMRGRTVYVAIGVGDVGRPGTIQGTTVPNPNALSSPIFSSILAIHFSAHVEMTTTGFTLSLADQQALASRQTVTLSYGGGQTLTIVQIADFENFVPSPRPDFPGNVQLSNPFDLVGVGDRLYVTDGGRNLVWSVDIPTGAHSPLASFPAISNPAFGPPFIDAVPTGIAFAGDRLLVTLFRGFPFPPGTSVVEQVDLETGTHSPLVTGLKTAVDVLVATRRGDGSLLVLEHVSGGPGAPAASGPGRLLRIGASGQPPAVIDTCLPRATSMTLDEKTGTVYVTLLAGQIVAIRLSE